MPRDWGCCFSFVERSPKGSLDFCCGRQNLGEPCQLVRYYLLTPFHFVFDRQCAAAEWCEIVRKTRYTSQEIPDVEIELQWVKTFCISTGKSWLLRGCCSLRQVEYQEPIVAEVVDEQLLSNDRHTERKVESLRARRSVARIPGAVREVRLTKHDAGRQIT